MRMEWVKDPRSWGLWFCSGAALSRALAYRPGKTETLPIGLADVATVVQPWIYGILWFATAVTFGVLAARQLPVRVWQSALVGMPMLWGFLWLVGGIHDRSERGMTAGLLFFCMAGFFTCFILVPRRAPKAG